MDKKLSVIIIGAGPAGLIAGSFINGTALILEKKKRAGLKLLVSGSGQCNITHSGSIQDFLSHYRSSHLFLKPSIYSFSNTDTVKYFESKNIPMLTRDDGKVFPESLKSSDILISMLDSVKESGNSIKYNTTVKSIEKSEKVFIVKTEKDEYFCSKLIISTGGKSYTSTGSTGDGYKLAEKLGHKIISPVPGLSPVLINKHLLSSLSGLSFTDISISHWRNEKKVDMYNGDLLITHIGLSGPVILDNSRSFLSGDILKVNFADKIIDMKDFKSDIRTHGKHSIKKYLGKYQLAQRLVDKIIEVSTLQQDKNCADLNNSELKKLYMNLYSFSCEINTVGNFELAMVTVGGIDLSEVNPKTMESKIYTGLYFAGEVLDIDGDTGGYNIQAALSTGYKAAESINKSI